MNNFAVKMKLSADLLSKRQPKNKTWAKEPRKGEIYYEVQGKLQAVHDSEPP